MPACACSTIASGRGQPFLDRVAQAMERTHAGIAAPGKLELGRASGADQLIVDEVRGHADQGQVAPPLADDLVARREGDQVRESFERHHVAVVYRIPDRIFQG